MLCSPAGLVGVASPSTWTAMGGMRGRWRGQGHRAQVHKRCSLKHTRWGGKNTATAAHNTDREKWQDASSILREKDETRRDLPRYSATDGEVVGNAQVDEGVPSRYGAP